MWSFLIDEDVPRSTARVLRSAGYDAIDVRDIGLRGHKDQEIFEFAQRERRVLITCDLGFANLLRFPLFSHKGIMVIRIPDEVSVERFNEEILKALAALEGESLERSLVIVELGRIRIRRESFIPEE